MQTKDYILKGLQNYKESVAALNMLKLELANFQGVTADEAIESLALQQNGGERVQSSGTSDKTSRVAMLYPAYCDRLNSEAKTDVANRLYTLQRETQLLEIAVAGLPADEQYVLTGFYFEGKTISQLARDFMVTERTVRRYREDALTHLVLIYHRYNYLAEGGRATNA